MGFSEVSNMKPPRGFLCPFGGFLDFTFINYQKGGNEYDYKKVNDDFHWNFINRGLSAGVCHTEFGRDKEL
jgi:hypothetical protein